MDRAARAQSEAADAAEDGARADGPVVGDAFVDELNEAFNRGSLVGPETAARLIIAEFFQGGLEEYRAQRRDSPSLQMIAEHPRSRLRKPTLQTCLKVHEFRDRAAPRDWPVRYTHFKTILAVPRFEDQVALLDQMVAEGLTTRELADRAKLYMPPTKAGRPAEREYVKTFRHVGSRLNAEGALDGLDEARRSEEAKTAALARIEQLLEKLGELREELLEEVSVH
jgi:hypothetical protein